LFPTLSPYVYALGNPVSLVDVDGRFTPLGHCRVIQAGFTGKASWREIGPFASVSMQAWVDVKYMDYPRVHFDNLKSFEAVLANFRYVADLLKAGDTDSKARAFHAIGDFYAHSNYVELWIQFYGTPASVSEIPTIYEVLANPQKYAEFISFLEKNLQTEGNAEQHDALGKDDETTSEGSKMVGGHTLFQHAVDVAGRHVASEAVPKIDVPAATTADVQARKWQRYDPQH
jgi:hypothetical protein